MLSPMMRWTTFLSTSCILIFYDPRELMDDPPGSHRIPENILAGRTNNQ
jgi:hypothetical protein